MLDKQHLFAEGYRLRVLLGGRQNAILIGENTQTKKKAKVESQREEEGEGEEKGEGEGGGEGEGEGGGGERRREGKEVTWVYFAFCLDPTDEFLSF